MRTGLLALGLPIANLHSASESLPLRQSQLRGPLRAPQREVVEWQRRGTAEAGERVPGLTWEFPEVSVRMFRPMFPVILQEYAEHSLGDSVAKFPVGRIPNET
jgi:hypothetical protein